MAVKLYVIPGSHPSKAAELMLEHKRIPFKRVDLVTAMHRPSLRLLGFERKTVPAMKADGRVRYVGISTSEGRRHAGELQSTREVSFGLREVREAFEDARDSALVIERCERRQRPVDGAAEREAGERLAEEVDAAAVVVNASTRFTDGEQFGFGAEIGISTQKLHARGPMGLRELTTVKYVVEGDGQVRG